MDLKSTVLGILIVLSLIAPIASVSAKPGITACGVIYNCGEEDGICPIEFGAKCDAPDWCDDDCRYGEALENSDSECSDKADNDCDGKKDCDDSYCAGLGGCVGEVVEAKEEPEYVEREIIVIAPEGGEKPAPSSSNAAAIIAVSVGGGVAAVAGAAYLFLRKK